jgi:CRISPR/Cas system CMR-associated protein Cmr1 (group 7 of RAMP superfamily)
LYSEVKLQSDQLKVRHEKFQDMVRNVDTSTNPEFLELRKSMNSFSFFILTVAIILIHNFLDLVKDVRVVDRKLKGLKEAVEVVSPFIIIIVSNSEKKKYFVIFSFVTVVG